MSHDSIKNRISLVSGIWLGSALVGVALAFLLHNNLAEASIAWQGGNVTITGNTYVNGALAKGSGSFVIDHPLDPENKLLYHSFVESPDVKNLYDGITTLDKNGEAVVELPDYFEALNKDFRYQAKGLDQPAPDLYIKSEIKNNRFTIAGGPPSARVSWQVTGIRHDPHILAHPIVTEVEKGPDSLLDKGEYLFEGYGQQ